MTIRKELFLLPQNTSLILLPLSVDFSFVAIRREITLGIAMQHAKTNMFNLCVVVVEIAVCCILFVILWHPSASCTVSAPLGLLICMYCVN